MNVIFSVVLLLGAMYLIWWGYKNLLRRESESGAGVVEGQACHLCRRAFPISELVIREKLAGFENYFCGECIRGLMRDLLAREQGTGNREQEVGSASAFSDN